MQQVSIKMIKTSWLSDWDTSKRFFKALIDDGDLQIFKNRTIVELVAFMWNVSRVYFIGLRFLPFLVCQYVPFTLFVFINIEAQIDSWRTTSMVCLGLMAVY